MKVCQCEQNMAEKIIRYCEDEIATKEMMIKAMQGENAEFYKTIEEAGNNTLRRVINKVKYLTG